MSIDTKKPKNYRKSWRKGCADGSQATLEDEGARIAVDEWNEHHAVGTLVEYVSYPGALPRRTVTRSEAQVLSGHSAVVWLEGVAGCYDLSHVRAVASDAAKKEPGR